MLSRLSGCVHERERAFAIFGENDPLLEIEVVENEFVVENDARRQRYPDADDDCRIEFFGLLLSKVTT